MTTKSTFILGGIRSGKSAFAEEHVLESGLNPTYIATGRAYDDEMVARIDLHKQRRGSEWACIEEPLELVDALQSIKGDNAIVLVDCLTLWITNLMMAERDVLQEAEGLAAFLKSSKIPVVLVSNDVGMGIIPENAMAREFCDLAGSVHQRVAEVSNKVYWVVAGLPQQIK